MCVFMFSSPVGGLCYYGAPSQEFVCAEMWPGIGGAPLCSTPRLYFILLFLLYSFCVCVSFAGSWDLGSRSPLLPFVNHQLFTGESVSSTASGAGISHRLFFLCIFATGAN